MSDGSAEKRRVTRGRWGLVLLAVAAALLFLSARTTKVEVVRRGGETVWACAWWGTALAGTAAGLALVAAGLLASALVRWVRVLAVLPVVLGLMVGLTSYETAADRVTITATEVEVPPYGLVRSPVRMAFAEIGGVMVLGKEGKVEFYRKDRTTVTIPIGTLVRAALPELIEALRAHGVMVAED